MPSGPVGAPAQPARAAEHERRRVVDDRSPGGGAASALRGLVDQLLHDGREAIPATRRAGPSPHERSAPPLCRVRRTTRSGAGGRPRPRGARYALALVTRDAGDAGLAAASLAHRARRRAVVGLPLLVAVVALHRQRWYPVLDLAMTEFRVRDVFTSHTPLIGLPGRIGEYPDQGSHPGPLSFYLLARRTACSARRRGRWRRGRSSSTCWPSRTALWIGHRRLGGRVSPPSAPCSPSSCTATASSR